MIAKLLLSPGSLFPRVLAFTALYFPLCSWPIIPWRLSLHYAFFPLYFWLIILSYFRLQALFRFRTYKHDSSQWPSYHNQGKEPHAKIEPTKGAESDHKSRAV